MTDFSKDFSWLREHYTKLVETHGGDSSEAVQFADPIPHYRRFSILTEPLNLGGADILDFGCGSGHFLTHLKNEGIPFNRFIGYDLSQAMIDAAAKRHPEGLFEVRNIFEDSIPHSYDYAFVSGVFNNALSDNWGFMKLALKTLFQNAKKGIAFNAISTYVNYTDDSLFYIAPEKVFQFCKETLSPFVSMRNDYLLRDNSMPFEFTTYVYKSNLECIPRFEK